MNRIYLPVFVLCTIILISLAAPWLAPYQPNAIDMTARLEQPSSHHLLGTDSLGRDLFSRLLHGGRQSMLLSLAATLVALMIGLMIGFVTGYRGGKIDLAITGLSNMLMGIPSISIKIVIIGLLGPGVISLLIAIVVHGWVTFSRVVRGEVMRIKGEYYIEAARNLGLSEGEIFRRHILPNVSDSLVVLFFTRIGSTLLSVAALSYLGLGLQPPQPDWSIMIADARPYFRSLPWLVIAPGAMISLLVWSVLSIGDAVRDQLDIRGLDHALD